MTTNPTEPQGDGLALVHIRTDAGLRRPGGAGYTNDPKYAGIWERHTAEQITSGIWPGKVPELIPVTDSPFKTVEAQQEPITPLPDELQGPWHPDERGTVNDHGWGFSIIGPDEWWGVEPDEVPEEVAATAQLLERTIRYALSAMEPQRIAGGWRPISEAPKDGTWVLGCESGYLPIVVQWDVNGGKAAWIDGIGDAFGEGSPYEITHFVSLPDPITATRES